MHVLLHLLMPHAHRRPAAFFSTDLPLLFSDDDAGARAAAAFAIGVLAPQIFPHRHELHSVRDVPLCTCVHACARTIDPAEQSVCPCMHACVQHAYVRTYIRARARACLRVCAPACLRAYLRPFTRVVVEFSEYSHM